MRLFILLAVLFSSTMVASELSEADKQAEPKVDVTPIPEWVSPASADLKRPATEQMGGARYLLSDQQEDISAPGLRRFAHVVMQPVNEQGLEQVSEIRVSFNPNFESMHWHHIDVIRNGKRSTRLDQKKLKIYSDEKDMKSRQYNGRVASLAILEDIRVGDIIDYAFTIEGMNPVLGEKRFGSFSTSWGAAVEKVNLRLVTNTGQYVNFSKKKLVKTSRENSNTIYSWQFADTPAIKDEDNIPGWFSPYDYIEYTEYKNWSQVIDWALPLYQPQPLPSSLEDKITQWKKQYSRKKDQLAAAVQFVQDEIRYFGIEIGQNTHRPYTPSEIMQRRFGDCKDKAVLLTSIFSRLGVKASPALVSSYAGKKLPDNLPSPGLFDHVITWFPFQDKEYWIDGTISHQRGGIDLMGVVNYENALIIDRKTKALKAVKPDPKRRPMINTTEEYSILDDQFTTRLTVTTVYDGIKADSLRYRIASNGLEDLEKRNLNFYAQYFNQIESEKPVEISDDIRKNQLVLTEHYLIKDWTVNQTGKRYLPLIAADINDFIFKPRIRNRQFPFSIAHGFDYAHKQILHIPRDKVIGFDSSQASQSTPYFNYRRQVQQTDEEIVVSRHFSPKLDYVKAEKTSDYLKKVKALSDALGIDVVLANSNTSDLKSQDKKLRSLAQRLLKRNKRD